MADRGDSTEPLPSTDRSWIACGLAYTCAWGVFVVAEVVWPQRDAPVGGLLEWLLAADVDTLVTIGLLLLAPIAFWLRGAAPEQRGASHTGSAGRWRTWVTSVAQATKGSIGRAVGLSVLVAATSLGMSAWVGRHFEGLPPAYHDEFSYLFQARTFLARRVSFPSHDAARLFDQMHVLNEGRFASRYFPGTGAWMAPFVALGNPWWGHWVAGAVSAMLIFWCGRELAGDFAGWLAGMLIAVAPGMALFSNLLLAHHPTLVGLGLFLLGALRCLRQPRVAWGLVAGIGLCFAALCRPMTAAGVALPFGGYFLCWSLAGLAAKSRINESAQRYRILLAIGMPLVAGGALMFFYDRAITGSGWRTPYGLYTEIYTPRHMYGFNNVVRGEQQLGPRVIEKYDEWAENLTPRLAVHNVAQRLVASWKWTLGLLPLTLALVAGLVWWRRLETGTQLVFAAIVSLHAVHVPYWFVGMFNHHYVFESGPLWMLWTAAITRQAFRAWQVERRWWLPGWWLGVLAIAVVMNYGVRGGRWSSPLDEGLAQVRFAREKHRRFQDLIAREVQLRPAIVLVEDDPADRHIDYVTNDPALQGEVLLGRYLPELVPVPEIRRLFPHRSVFLYHARTGQLERLVTAN